MTTTPTETEHLDREYPGPAPQVLTNTAVADHLHTLLNTQQRGHRDWNTAAAKLAGGIGTAVPVLRMLDVPSAHEFHVDYLGRTVEWEHRFEPGMPLYTRIQRDNVVIDLSEHHGDGTPGSGVQVANGIRFCQAVAR